MSDLLTDLDGFHRIITTIEHFTSGMPDAPEKLNELNVRSHYIQ